MNELERLLRQWYETREVSNTSEGDGPANLHADRAYGKACDELAEFLRQRPVLMGR